MTSCSMLKPTSSPVRTPRLQSAVLMQTGFKKVGLIVAKISASDQWRLWEAVFRFIRVLGPPASRRQALPTPHDLLHEVQVSADSPVQCFIAGLAGGTPALPGTPHHRAMQV